MDVDIWLKPQIIYSEIVSNCYHQNTVLLYKDEVTVLRLVSHQKYIVNIILIQYCTIYVLHFMYAFHNKPMQLNYSKLFAS